MAELTRGQRNAAWIEAHCIIPEGRLVGQPMKLSAEQKEWVQTIYDSPTRRLILSMARKQGKALALDTPIPTPSGWRTMADVHPGDYVYGADGSPVQVLVESEVFVGKRCYRVGFSDGSSIVASEDHVWTTRHKWRPWEEPARYSGGKVRGRGAGTGKREVSGNVTTAQIAQTLCFPRPDGGFEANHKIDVAAPLESVDIPLPIDPYVLGVWLGDGGSADARFTCSDDDLPHLREELNAALGVEVRVARYGSRSPTVNAPGSGLQAALRSTGLLGNKHIPSVYFDAGTNQRWALLQGLMDTDGTVTVYRPGSTPRCEFTGTNQNLCYGVWRLARSLGLKAKISEGRATLRGRDCGAKWRVTFTASRESPVFRLDRKQAILPEKIGKRSTTLTITSCDEVESVPTKCIGVDSADHLFLAGHGCVPTHNTAFSACLLLLHLVGPEARPNSQLYSAAQSREQAGILFALAAKMVRMSPDLSQYVTVRDTAKQLFCPELGTLYRALSADASTAYGLSPVFVVHDELGQVRGPRSELYEALETASGAQEEPLSIVISTQAPTDADLLSVLIDDALKGEDPRTKVVLYSADEDLDPFGDEAIRQAAPHFDVFMNQQEVRDQAEAARRMPSREAAYRNLVLNQRINATNPFVSRAVWTSCGGDVDRSVFETAPVYMGLDLSARNDLTAIAAVAQDESGVWHAQLAFFAPEIGVVDRANRDRVPYDVWAKDGFIQLTPGASVDYETVAKWLAEFTDGHDVASIQYDRWRMDILKAEIARLGIELPLEPFGQGYRDMTPALDTLEAELLNGKVRHGMNPVLTMCAANAVETKDAAGGRKLDKSKATGRIDGMVALAMALGGAAKHSEETIAEPSLHFLSW